MTRAQSKTSLEKTTRRLRLRREAQPRVIDRDGSDCGCLGRRSRQSRDPPPAQNRAHEFSRELSKKTVNLFGYFA